MPHAVGYAVYRPWHDGFGCKSGNRLVVAQPRYGYTPTATDLCPYKYTIAAVFQLRDFPTAGATFEVEGPRAFVQPVW